MDAINHALLINLIEDLIFNRGDVLVREGFGIGVGIFFQELPHTSKMVFRIELKFVGMLVSMIILFGK